MKFTRRNQNRIGGARSPKPALALWCMVAAGIVIVSAAKAQPPQAAPDQGLFGQGLLGRFSLGSQRGPVTITAGKLEFEYKERRLTYRQDVTVKQADMTLRADVLRVALGADAAKQLKEVVAEGAVKITQGERVATGGRAIYDETSRTVVLSDPAVLKEGRNEMTGDRVVVYLDEERMVVEGGKEQVRVVFVPEQEKPTTAGTASPETAGEKR